MFSNAYLFNYIDSVSQHNVKYGFAECDSLEPNLRALGKTSTIAKSQEGQDHTSQSSFNSKHATTSSILSYTKPADVIQRTGDRGINKALYSEDSNEIISLINQRLLHIFPDPSIKSDVPPPQHALASLTTIGKDQSFTVTEKTVPNKFTYQQKTTRRGFGWEEFRQMYPSAPHISNTRHISFCLPFATETIVEWIYAPTVHTFFVSTSDGLLFVMNKEGEVVSSGGVLGEEAEELSKKTDILEQQEKQRKEEDKIIEDTVNREIGKIQQRHIKIAKIRTQKDDDVKLSINPGGLVRQTLGNRIEPTEIKSRIEREVDTGMKKIQVEKPDLKQSVFTLRGGIPWFPRKALGGNSDAIEKKSEQTAISLCYVPSTDCLLAGFISGEVRIFKYSPSFFPHTINLGKFRLEFVCAVQTGHEWVREIVCADPEMDPVKEEYQYDKPSFLTKKYPSSLESGFYTAKMEYDEATQARLDTSTQNMRTLKKNATVANLLSGTESMGETARMQRETKVDHLARDFTERVQKTEQSMGNLKGLLSEIGMKTRATSQKGSRNMTASKMKEIEAQVERETKRHSISRDTGSVRGSQASVPIEDTSSILIKHTASTEGDKDLSGAFCAICIVGPTMVCVNSQLRKKMWTRINAHSKSISCAHFLVHTKKREFDVIATGGLDGMIKAWNGNGDALWSQYCHTKEVTGLEGTRYGDKLFSCSKDGVVKCWNVLNGSCLAEMNMESPLLSMHMMKTLPPPQILADVPQPAAIVDVEDGIRKDTHQDRGSRDAAIARNNRRKALSTAIVDPLHAEQPEIVHFNALPGERGYRGDFHTSLCVCSADSIRLVAANVPLDFWMFPTSRIARFFTVTFPSNLYRYSWAAPLFRGSISTASHRSSDRYSVEPSLFPMLTAALYEDGSVHFLLHPLQSSLSFSLPSTLSPEDTQNLCFSIITSRFFALNSSQHRIMRSSTHGHPFMEDDKWEVMGELQLTCMSSTLCPSPAPNTRSAAFKLFTRFFRFGHPKFNPNQNDSNDSSLIAEKANTPDFSSPMPSSPIPSPTLSQSSNPTPTPSPQFGTGSKPPSSSSRSRKWELRERPDELLVCGTNDGKVAMFDSRTGEVWAWWLGNSDRKIQLIEYAPMMTIEIPFVNGEVREHGVIVESDSEAGADYEQDTQLVTPIENEAINPETIALPRLHKGKKKKKTIFRIRHGKSKQVVDLEDTKAPADSQDKKTFLTETNESEDEQTTNAAKMHLPHAKAGTIISVSESGNLKLWNAHTLLLLCSADPMPHYPHGVHSTGVAVIGSNIGLSFTDGSVAFFCHLTAKQKYHQHDTSNPSSDDYIATLASSSLSADQIPPHYVFPIVPQEWKHRASANCIIASSELNIFATCGDDGAVKIWSAQGYLLRDVAFGLTNPEPLSSISFVGLHQSILIELHQGLYTIPAQEYLPSGYKPDALNLKDDSTLDDLFQQAEGDDEANQDPSALAQTQTQLALTQAPKQIPRMSDQLPLPVPTCFPILSLYKQRMMLVLKYLGFDTNSVDWDDPTPDGVIPGHTLLFNPLDQESRARTAALQSNELNPIEMLIAKGNEALGSVTSSKQITSLDQMKPLPKSALLDQAPEFALGMVYSQLVSEAKILPDLQTPSGPVTAHTPLKMPAFSLLSPGVEEETEMLWDESMATLPPISATLKGDDENNAQTDQPAARGSPTASTKVPTRNESPLSPSIFEHSDPIVPTPIIPDIYTADLSPTEPPPLSFSSRPIKTPKDKTKSSHSSKTISKSVSKKTIHPHPPQSPNKHANRPQPPQSRKPTTKRPSTKSSTVTFPTPPLEALETVTPAPVRQSHERLSSEDMRIRIVESINSGLLDRDGLQKALGVVEALIALISNGEKSWEWRMHYLDRLYSRKLNEERHNLKRDIHLTPQDTRREMFRTELDTKSESFLTTLLSSVGTGTASTKMNIETKPVSHREWRELALLLADENSREQERYRAFMERQALEKSRPTTGSGAVETRESLASSRMEFENEIERNFLKRNRISAQNKDGELFAYWDKKEERERIIQQMTEEEKQGVIGKKGKKKLMPDESSSDEEVFIKHATNIVLVETVETRNEGIRKQEQILREQEEERKAEAERKENELRETELRILREIEEEDRRKEEELERIEKERIADEEKAQEMKRKLKEDEDRVLQEAAEKEKREQEEADARRKMNLEAQKKKKEEERRLEQELLSLSQPSKPAKKPKRKAKATAPSVVGKSDPPPFPSKPTIITRSMDRGNDPELISPQTITSFEEEEDDEDDDNEEEESEEESEDDEKAGSPMEPAQFPPELNSIISEVPALIRTDSGFVQPVSTVNNEATQSVVLHDTTAPLDAVTPHFAVDVKSSIEPSPTSSLQNSYTSTPPSSQPASRKHTPQSSPQQTPKSSRVESRSQSSTKSERKSRPQSASSTNGIVLPKSPTQTSLSSVQLTPTPANDASLADTRRSHVSRSSRTSEKQTHSSPVTRGVSALSISPPSRLSRESTVRMGRHSSGTEIRPLSGRSMHSQSPMILRQASEGPPAEREYLLTHEEEAELHHLHSAQNLHLTSKTRPFSQRSSRPISQRSPASRRSRPTSHRPQPQSPTIILSDTQKSNERDLLSVTLSQQKDAAELKTDTAHPEATEDSESFHGLQEVTDYETNESTDESSQSQHHKSKSQPQPPERDADVPRRQGNGPLPRAVASKTPESEKQRQLRLLSTYSHILTDTGSSTSSSSWEYYYSEESSEEFRRHEIIEKLNREKAVLHTKTLELDLPDTPAKPSRRGSSANSLRFFHQHFRSSSSDAPPKGSVEATLPPSQQPKRRLSSITQVAERAHRQSRAQRDGGTSPRERGTTPPELKAESLFNRLEYAETVLTPLVDLGMELFLETSAPNSPPQAQHQPQPTPHPPRPLPRPSSTDNQSPQRSSTAATSQRKASTSPQSPEKHRPQKRMVLRRRRKHRSEKASKSERSDTQQDEYLFALKALRSELRRASQNFEDISIQGRGYVRPEQLMEEDIQSFASQGTKVSAVFTPVYRDTLSHNPPHGRAFDGGRNRSEDDAAGLERQMNPSRDRLPQNQKKRSEQELLRPAPVFILDSLLKPVLPQPITVHDREQARMEEDERNRIRLANESIGANLKLPSTPDDNPFVKTSREEYDDTKPISSHQMIPPSYFASQQRRTSPPKQPKVIVDEEQEQYYPDRLILSEGYQNSVRPYRPLPNRFRAPPDVSAISIGKTGSPRKGSGMQSPQYIPKTDRARSLSDRSGGQSIPSSSDPKVPLDSSYNAQTAKVYQRDPLPATISTKRLWNERHQGQGDSPQAEYLVSRTWSEAESPHSNGHPSAAHSTRNISEINNPPLYVNTFLLLDSSKDPTAQTPTATPTTTPTPIPFQGNVQSVSFQEPFIIGQQQQQQQQRSAGSSDQPFDIDTPPSQPSQPRQPDEWVVPTLPQLPPSERPPSPRPVFRVEMVPEAVHPLDKEWRQVQELRTRRRNQQFRRTPNSASHRSKKPLSGFFFQPPVDGSTEPGASPSTIPSLQISSFPSAQTDFRPSVRASSLNTPLYTPILPSDSKEKSRSLDPTRENKPSSPVGESDTPSQFKHWQTLSRPDLLARSQEGDLQELDSLQD
ncbi:hypothetical protein BLNAU_15618 [Blattamonas nauphoetae]|uniref:Uncharacterized protein n=1 Tax=Blattamonas nauphoetae TaxID=2049346 RepID=A0ABQ9XAC8_9EUKA|nr:hypothetical protein BLNAU_15618 [Blattamonas nauphoetae]